MPNDSLGIINRAMDKLEADNKFLRTSNAKWLRLAWALFHANIDEKSCPYCEKQTRKGEHDAACELNALWLMIDEVDPTSVTP